MDTTSAVLVHQNDRGLEKTIAFFNKGLEGYEKRHNFIEKHMLALEKILKKFRHLVSNSKIHIMVSHPSVKELLLRKDLNVKKVGCITRVMEYDVDIQVTKFIRGNGLCEQLSNEKTQVIDEVAETVLANQDIPQKNQSERRL